MKKLFLIIMLGLTTFIPTFSQRIKLREMEIQNKVNLSPVHPADNSKLLQKIGDVYMDAVDSTLYMYDGKKLTAIPKGETGYETLTFTPSIDSLDFNAVTSLAGFNVVYEVETVGLNSDNATVSLYETYDTDSVYILVETTNELFPFSVGQADNITYLVYAVCLKYQRFKVDWGTVTDGVIYIRRKIKVL